MFGLKSNPSQALWWFTIVASSYLPLKRFINRFCHKFANFNKLKGGQLWLNTCHRWLVHKNGLLQTSHSYHQYSRPCKGHYRHDNKRARAFRLDYYQPGVPFYLKVLVIAMLFSRHQAKAIYRLLPTNG